MSPMVFHALRRLVVVLVVLLVLAGCADVIDYDNPFDPESPASPLGSGILVLDFSVIPDPSGNRSAFLQWEAVPEASRYEAEILGPGSDAPLFSSVTAGTEVGPAQVDPSTSYDARIRYEAQFDYLGGVRTAWSPWRAAGTVAFDTGGVPADLSVESYIVEVVDDTRGELVITFDVPGWNGDPPIFARIEPDPLNTAFVELRTFELTFFLPVAWGQAYDVIAFDEQGRERTVFSFELGAFEDINPLVSSLAFPDPVVQSAFSAAFAPDTRVSDVEFLTIGTGATSIQGLERFLWLRGLYLDDSSITNLSPIAELGALVDLTLTNTPIADLTPIAGIRSLEFLNLELTPVPEIGPVAGLTNMVQIQIGDSDIADLTPLANLTNLQVLWSQRNRVTDITPILGLSALRELYLYQPLQPLTSVAGIGALSSLVVVDLSESPALAAGVEELATLPNLRSVNLFNSLSIPAVAVTEIEAAFTGVSGFTMTRPDGSAFVQ